MRRGVVVLVGVLASSCGRSVCDEAVAAWARLGDKRGACGVPVLSGSPAACEAQFAKGECTSADEQVTRRFIDCLDAIPQSVVSGRDWANLIDICVAGLSTRTAACTF